MRVGSVVKQDKPLLWILTSYVRMPGAQSHLCFWSSLMLLLCCEAVKYGPTAWVPATHVSDRGRIPGSCFGLPGPSVAGIWQVNQWIENLCSSLSLLSPSLCFPDNWTKLCEILEGMETGVNFVVYIDSIQAAIVDGYCMLLWNKGKLFNLEIL